MTRDQVEIIIQLINARVAIAAHPQTPPRFLYDEADRLEQRLLDSAEEED